MTGAFADILDYYRNLPLLAWALGAILAAYWATVFATQRALTPVTLALAAGMLAVYTPTFAFIVERVTHADLETVADALGGEDP